LAGGAPVNALLRILFPRAAKIAAAARSADPEQARFCRDCKHRRADSVVPRLTSHDGCYAPQNVTIDLVSGRRVRFFKYCETHRASAGDKYCGPIARWFEPKQTKPLAEAGTTQED
jgi:hypothetical protein